MKRYKWLLVVVVVMVGMFMTGCTKTSKETILLENKPPTEQEQTMISFFGFKADAVNLIATENIVGRYMALNPDVMVTYEGVKGTNYWKAFERRVYADTLDDVVMIDHDRVVWLSGEGKLADLSDLPAVDRYQDIIRSQFMEEDGSAYFLPTCISAYGMYINYDLLKKHGQKVPENWQEFSEVCDYFVKKGITPIVGNNYSTCRCLMVAKSMFDIYQREDRDEQIEALNKDTDRLTEMYRPGVELIEEMVRRKWIDGEELLNTRQTQDDLVLFAAGDRPFMVTGAWATRRVAAMEPGFSYGVHPFPVQDDGSVLVVDANTCIAVNAGSEQLEEAKEFVEYLTRADEIWEYCESQSSYSPLKDNKKPTDKTIDPSTEALQNGRIVIGTDYRWDLPVDGSLCETSEHILKGADANEAMDILKTLLKQQR